MTQNGGGVAGKGKCVVCLCDLSLASNYYSVEGTVTSSSRVVVGRWLRAAVDEESVRWGEGEGEDDEDGYLCRACFLLINLSDKLQTQAARLKAEVVDKIRAKRTRAGNDKVTLEMIEETVEEPAVREMEKTHRRSAGGSKKTEEGKTMQGKRKSIRSRGGQCEECGKLFRSTPCLQAHRSAHRGEFRFRCKACPRGFNLRSSLRLHERRHSEERPLVCELCGAAYRHAASLRLHQGRAHGPPLFPPYHRHTCKECGRNFAMVSHLVIHQRRVHTGERPFACTFQGCPMRFVTRNELQRHLCAHTRKFPFSCKICNRGFRSALLLARHETARHSSAPAAQHQSRSVTASKQVPSPELQTIPPLPSSPQTHHEESPSHTLLLQLPHLVLPDGATALTVQFLKSS